MGVNVKISVEFKKSMCSSVRLHIPATVLTAMVMVACGGGGTSDTTAPTTGVTPTTPTTTTSTVLVTANSSKAAWKIVTPVSLTLKDASGTALAGPLTCTSDNVTTLIVAADCSTVTGQRLGTQTFTVSSASGVSAKASVKVIPQAQPLGSHGTSSVNLVVTPDGRALVWGANTSGSLGQGSASTQLSQLRLPTAVKDASGQGELKGIVAASGGKEAALALTEDGEIYSWGYVNNALGRTTSSNNLAEPQAGKVMDPTGNAPLKHIVAISMGDDNALALSDDGLVFAWGNYTGTGLNRFPITVPMAGGTAPLTNAAAVSAGFGWNAVLLENGRVLTWGFGSNGTTQGQGMTASAVIPAPGYVLSAATGQPISGVVSLSAGYLFGMALTSTGQVFTWGSNHFGQGGQGTLYNDLYLAVLVKDEAGMAPLGNIVMVAAGGNHALAMDAQGRVLSWGYSVNGQLGDGPNGPRINQSAIPATVMATSGIGQLTGIRALAAGFSRSFAVAEDGHLLIWGDGSDGSLGQGNGSSDTSSRVPLNVKDESGTGTLSIAPLSYWPNLLNKAR